MNLPRIAVIDDQFGRVGVSRRDLCAMYGLADVTGDDPEPEPVSKPLAEAVFCSAQMQHESRIENDQQQAIDVVSAGWPFPDGRRWALVLLDLRFVSGSIGLDDVPEGRSGDDTYGMEILKELHSRFPDVPVVILSSRERAEVIEDCRKLGAVDFIQRHGSLDGPLPRALLASKLSEYGLLEDSTGTVVGRSLSLLKVLAAARRAATGGGNILILGGSGTGKELLARYLHHQSPKAKGPYKIFSAFGTAESLQEDLLFGHVKGAFTDAKSDREGIFEQADGGTLFVDEIGDIPETLQNKLLRPIETRRISRQGMSEEIEVDIQLVLATNKSLDSYTSKGHFKSDLLNRIRAYTLTLPPLCDRRDDIPLLVNHLLENLCQEHGARWPRTVHEDAMQMLMDYDWQDGNVRELRNVLERVVKDNKDSEIVVAGDIRFEISAEQVEVFQRVPAIRSPDTGSLLPGSNDWLAVLRKVIIKPDYALLHGSWPPMQREIALLLAQYLASAIEVTRKRRAAGPSNGEINLTGAVSCLLGQQVPTVKAADFVKRLLQFDDDAGSVIFEQYPVLHEALQQAFRNRPKRPKKAVNDSGGGS